MSRPDLLPVFLEEARRHLGEARECLAGEDAAGAGVSELFRHFHSIKGMAASLALDAIMEEAHSAEDALDALRRGRAEPAAGFRQTLEGRLERLGAMIDAVEEDLRIPVAIPVRPSAPGQESKSTARLPSLRVEPERLDRLMEITLRLSSTQQRLEHSLGLPDDPTLAAMRDALRRSLRDLRREVLELRLLPVRALVPVLEDALRRWAREQELRVGFHVEGESVQVDRAILERLLDPLGNLLRNAVVHGLERPASRLAAGKDARGRVDLRVSRAGAELCFEVQDDGRGVDPREVRSWARRQGLVSADSKRTPSSEEVFEWLVAPGMSSRREALPLAGRGVGLASVRTEVERLGGRLVLSSASGRGFTARILLPARVAMIDVFLVEAGGQSFAIPVSSVSEVQATEDRGRASRRQPVVLSCSLARQIGVAELVSRGESPPGAALIIEGDKSPMALLVDRVLCRQEVVVRPLGAPLDRLNPWSDVALLREGGLALLVDPLRVARGLSCGTKAASLAES